MEGEKRKIAIYALTRGYSGLSKIRYSFVIRRNISLRKIVPTRLRADYLLFHEGNISRFDQLLIQFFSLMRINFINVSHVFVPDPNQVTLNLSRRDLGYSLMCRFHYRDVWPLLADYDLAYRIDEDCVVTQFPLLKDDEIFMTGFVTDETHIKTNETLPVLLKELGLLEFYDHKFPYTNYFVTRVEPWLQPEVKSVLNRIGSHPNALIWRWGDLPIIGVVIKAFYSWDAKTSINGAIQYSHLSHNAQIGGGRMTKMKRNFFIRMRRIFKEM